MPGNCVLGWPNRFTFGTINDSSEEPTLPGANLANDQGSAEQGWQTLAGVTAARIQVDIPTDGFVGACGLFRTNLTPDATVRWVVQTLAGATTFDGGTRPAGVVPGYGQTVTILPAGIVGSHVYCDISDPTNPDAFLNASLAFAGPLWQPSRNFGYQSAPGRTAQATRAATRSGGVVIRSDWVKRVWALSLSGVRAAEVDILMDLDLYARRGNNVLFVPSPDDAARNRQALFGEFEPTSNVTYPLQTADARGYAATLTERL